MIRTITIDAAMSDRKLLGAGLGDLASWATWRSVLLAAFGHSLNEQQQQAFSAVAGGRQPPARSVRELIAIAGRRSGKSRIAAAIAAYIAACIDHRAKLAAGETGFVLVLSASRAQANVVSKYALGFFEASPILRREIAEVTAEEIRLRNGIIIGVHPNSFRTVRGRTLLACIFDETAYWRDEGSANPDVETYRAVLPALSTTDGVLVCISSPYRRAGLVFAKHRDYFGKDDDEVLVVQGRTAIFNPTINASVLERAKAADPEAARAEWEAEFRSDLAAYLDDATIDAAIDHARPLELPPRKGVTYQAFCDASGGRHDAFTLGIGHQEDDRCICDVIRGRHPPFDPHDVVTEYAATLKDYGIDRVSGDNYSAAWVEAAWSEAGISYERSEVNKSQIYLEALPIFTRGLVSLPDHSRLTRELRLLERRASRVGKDVVDHGRTGSDDYANALCGVLYALTGNGSSYASDLKWVGGPGIDDDRSDWIQTPPKVRQELADFAARRRRWDYGIGWH
jgi:hypothetical protein